MNSNIESVVTLGLFHLGAWGNTVYLHIVFTFCRGKTKDTQDPMHYVHKKQCWSDRSSSLCTDEPFLFVCVYLYLILKDSNLLRTVK